MTLGVPTSLAYEEPRIAATSDVPPHLWNNIKPWVTVQGKAIYTLPDLGHLGLFGSVWVSSFLCQKSNPHRSSRAMYHHVKPTQKLSEMRWSLVWALYLLLSMPHQQTQPETEEGHNPCHHYTPVSFSQRKPHCPGHRDMVSHCFLTATAGSSSAD